MQYMETRQERLGRAAGWRICALSAEGDDALSRAFGSASAEGGDYWAMCAEAVVQGFDTLSVPAEWLNAPEDAVFERLVQACSQAGLRLMADLVLAPPAAQAILPAGLDGLLDVPAVSAVCLRGMERLSTDDNQALLAALRARRSDLLITIWTPGMTPAQLAQLESLPIDGVYSSLPWWDYRDAWLLEEYERLRAVAPVIAPVADPREPMASGPAGEEAMRRLAVASVIGEGLLLPSGFVWPAAHETRLPGMAWPVEPGKNGTGPRRLTGPLSEVTALFRGGAAGRLLLLNPDRHRGGSVSRALIERRLPNGFVLESPPPRFELAAGAWQLIPLASADSIAKHGTTSSELRRGLSAALRGPRIVIEAVRPAVDEGAFAVKRTLGETVVIQADIFMDGHEELAAELLWRPANETEWHHVPMAPLGNDAWEARVTPRQLGRYIYEVSAWVDTWRSFCVQLHKKAAAGQDVRLEVEEGRRTLARYLDEARNEGSGALPAIEAALRGIGLPSDGAPVRKRGRARSGAAPRPLATGQRDETAIPPADAGQVETLLDPGLADAIQLVDEHAFETRTSAQYPLDIERNEVMFSAWYELFPRSQSPVAGRHGTLRDVIQRLPAIRRMGFDVLYFPPIHPIGHSNRKGRNNSLVAGPDDPGSPYAIGSEEGGHDAVHPELGTLEDFRALLAAARRHGMEVALDFAIQCSPDHPWLREHPDWFNWRADGSLKHAENPPKRYEDIVTPDFYSAAASTPRQAALWRALRDIVLFWVHQGVQIFRVDNPHTKPLPFWQWMLREVRSRHPDTLFLSEAFTRPAMMYRLAKLGFSQSYTYFTWRNTKQELTDYMTELNRTPVRDFFRPNFFVNTPDINPWFLQSSGRAGFLIRAVLAGTLSGSWGMYNGFELCVADAVPGKEEYLDSEKYQLRQWDMDAPGNIIEEITRLNRIRRSHPALQTHLGVRFHEVDNDRILFYSRHSPEGDSIVLAAVSLDPHHRQAGTMELPLWQWGLADDAEVPLHDLFEDRRFVLRGRRQTIELTPHRPFVLWALVREHGGPA